MKIKYTLPILIAACFIGCSDDGSSASANDAAESSAAFQQETPSSSADAADSTAISSSAGTTDSANAANSAGDSATSSSDDSDSFDSPDSQSSSTDSKAESGSKGYPANYSLETGILTDERDGEVYTTAKIGTQIWMGQNLRYIPDTNGMCVSMRLADDEENRLTYGHQYSWITGIAISCHDNGFIHYDSSFVPSDDIIYQGICPKGWHVPSVNEWQTLFDTVPVNALLDKSYATEEIIAEDEYGFSLLKKRPKDSENGFITTNVMSDKRFYIIKFMQLGNDIVVKLQDIGKLDDYQFLRCLMD